MSQCRTKNPSSSAIAREAMQGRRPCRAARPRTAIAVLVLLPATLLSGPNARAQKTPDFAHGVSTLMGAQGRLMWIDGTANIHRRIMVNGKETWIDYTSTREGVADVVRKCKAANINTLVVDVKPLSGEVLYNSKIAPHMHVWKGRPVRDFDVLAAFVEEGHKAGLQVDADINTLGEGHKIFHVGPGYEHPEWQSVVYTVDRGLVATNGARLSVHFSGEPSDPNAPAVLNDDSSVIGSGAVGAQVGLEGLSSGSAAVQGRKGMPFGRQSNVVLNAQNRVIGIIDSALLGDDPLVAPEDGRLIAATRKEDAKWIADNLKPEDYVRFDMRTARVLSADAPSEKVGVFVNPLQPVVRRRVLDIVRELVTNYDIDGIVLDRCRYANLNNDFSDLSRDAFARWLGKPIGRWPEDIYAFAPIPGQHPIDGPLYKPWLEFRAKVIRDLVADIARTARSIKPNITLGTYVGSWYPSYYEVGVNWGSEKTSLRYSWFTENYPQTGYAEFFDWIATGCYFPTATRDDARTAGISDHATVEAAAELSSQAVANGSFVYGGIYVPDYSRDPDRMIRALEAAGRQAQGWMIFDLVYINDFDWWPNLERAFPKAANAPNHVPGLLTTIRTAADKAQ